MTSSPGAPGRWRWVAHSPNYPPVQPHRPPVPRYRYGPAFSERPPKYPAVPRWGLPAVVRTDPPAPASKAGWTERWARNASSSLTIAGGIVGMAGLAHLVRYLVLAAYADRLVPSWVEGLTVVFPLVFGAFALLAGVVAMITGAAWLIDRRRQACAPAPDPRGPLQLWISCLLPVVNVVRPPVLLRELELAVPAASARGSARRIRRWWTSWVVNLLLVGAVLFRSRYDGPQAAADTVLLTALALFATSWVAWETRGVIRCFSNTHPGFTRRLLLRGMVSEEPSPKES